MADHRWDSATIFVISLGAILSELLFTSIVGLKAWSHMVYVVIAFSLLGYGVGANLFLILRERLEKARPEVVNSGCLLAIGVSVLGCSQLLPYLPVEMEQLLLLRGIASLAAVYLTVALPFVGIGFLVTYLFARPGARVSRLYFWDLVGAGLGALLFPTMVAWGGPLPAFALLASACLLLAAIRFFLSPAFSTIGAVLLGIGILPLGALFLPEPDYSVDEQVGWECIPMTFTPRQYRVVRREWSTLGRTDLYEFTSPAVQQKLLKASRSIFEIAYDPFPPFSYFTTNYRAGTPVHALSEEHRKKNGTTAKPFSEAMEFPYLLLDRPKVLVIGAGGGRDLHTAKVHGAPEVVGAEINPITHAMMSPGGAAHEYSGGIYTQPGVRVHNIDGRHLAKTQPPDRYDLLVLNGVDTFAALATGAYAYAENYLYTREAIRDYFKTLSPAGLMNFNRWHEDRPRESLRLFVMVLDALKAEGIRNPRAHVFVARHDFWGMTLVRKTPFSPADVARMKAYLKDRGCSLIFSPFEDRPAAERNEFDRVMTAFEESKLEDFIRGYWADISVVDDDSPFFYKYYRFTLSPYDEEFQAAGGVLAFRVQAVVVLQTTVFILIFILLPLFYFKRKGILAFPSGARLPLVLFFSGIGLGYILIEIALMQRLTLLLGSPIYSITVTLAALLVSSGIGSTLLAGAAGPRDPRRILGLMLLVVGYVAVLVVGGTRILNAAVAAPFALRVGVAVLIVAPAGLLLGAFFPTGLAWVGGRHAAGIPWAWGINSGFTVLGSTLATLVAQFTSFSTVLLLAAFSYVVAGLAFRSLAARLQKQFDGSPPDPIMRP